MIFVLFSVWLNKACDFGKKNCNCLVCELDKGGALEIGQYCSYSSLSCINEYLAIDSDGYGNK